MSHRIDREHVEGASADAPGRSGPSELEESHRTLRRLVDHLPGLVYRCRNDPTYAIEFISEGVEALTGYPASEFMEGRVLFGDLIHPDDAEGVWRGTQAGLAAKRRFQLIYRIRTASGAEKWVWEQGMGVESAHGEPLYIEGFVTDFTERKRVQDEHAQIAARLGQAQKMEALGRLAGGIAHDFNNVLAAIQGNVALALEDLPANSPALTSINEIKRGAARASDLVRQILAFSRQEVARRQPIAIAPVIAEALKLLRATLPTSVQISSDLQDNVPHVLADASQLHQIIMNLGVNAAHAIGTSEGTIHVRLDSIAVPSDAPDVEPALQAGQYVRVRVSDTGCGFDDETRKRIFEPFFTTKPAGQGTGLGLSLVHGIVLGHEGSISVESTPGKGSTFSLYFPAAQQPATCDSLAAASAPRGEGEHILYIDDEEALVFLAERALGRLGYRVTGCVDPSRALELFRAHPTCFDFVVTDLAMPGMSGSDVARELRKVRPDVPIVLTSGYVRPEDVQCAQRLGVQDVVLKPNSVEDLARVIAASLAGSARNSRATS